MLRFSPERREESVAPLEVAWPFVTVRMIAIAGQQVRLLVDTGSSDVVLFKSRMPAALSGAPWRGDKTVQYASGVGAPLRLDLRQVGLGAHVWDKLPAWALDGRRTDTHGASTVYSGCCPSVASACDSTSSETSSGGAAESLFANPVAQLNRATWRWYVSLFARTTASPTAPPPPVALTISIPSSSSNCADVCAAVSGQTPRR